MSANNQKGEVIMSKSNAIGLSEFIFQVKQDLLSKQFTDDDPVPFLMIDEVEVEVAVVATKEVGGGVNGKINLSILGLGEIGAEGGGKINKENAQTVRVKLSPIISKQELIDKLDPKQKKRIYELSRSVLARGEEEGTTPETA
jgi:hypothetical protein